MKRIYQNLSLILVILALAALPGMVAAADPIQVLDQSGESSFRDHLTFNLSAESTAADIVEVYLVYQVVGQIAASRNQAEFTPGKTIEAEFELDQTKPENYMPPGTELEYWWRIIDAAGNELETEKQSLLYLDDGHEWQTLENDRLTLYWYEGDESFGQAMFERANQALDTLESDAGITLEKPIKIFVYADYNDLHNAISATSPEWTGGQALPTYGVVMMGVDPNQLEWGLRATSHELSHLVIHQATDNPYRPYLPRWLDEGIAVYNEDPDELVEDFRPIFEQAVESDELLTLRSLASPFPADPYQANLAYGQSGAVVKFIIDTYGREAMAELLDIFAEGALDDEALEQALGVNTNGLDNAFRASLGLPPWPSTEGAASTSAETEPVAAPEEANAVEEVEPAENAAVPTTPTAESQDSTVAEAPAQPAPTQPAEQPAERNSSPWGSLPCLAGILPLVIFGLVTAKRNT